MNVNMLSVLMFFKEHSAYAAGAGFLVLAAVEYFAGDSVAAGKDVMLALASFGLKTSIEKVFNGVSAVPPTPPVSPK